MKTPDFNPGGFLSPFGNAVSLNPVQTIKTQKPMKKFSEKSLKNITKKKLAETIDELVELIEMKRNGIGNLKDEVEKLRESKQRDVDACHRLQNENNKLKKQLWCSHLEAIADVKSIQRLLSIYKSDTMTHREKAYLAQMIDQVFEEMMDKKISGINPLSLGEDLPF